MKTFRRLSLVLLAVSRCPPSTLIALQRFGYLGLKDDLETLENMKL
jgi:hypothetical protein